MKVPDTGNQAHLDTADLSQLVDQELKRCLDRAAEGLHWVGPDGTILWANRTELDLLGYTAEEYLGHNIAEFHVDAPVITDILDRLTRGETLLGYEARLRHRDGSIRHVQINSNVQWDGAKFLHTRCFTRDVTERKAADEVAARLAAIVEHSDDAIFSEDMEAGITSWNPAAERMFGYTAEQVMGQLAGLVIPADKWSEEQAVLGRIGRGEHVPTYETERVCASGERLTVSVTASPIRDRTGRLVGVSKAVRDIRVRKHFELRDRFLLQVNDSVRSLSDPEEIALTVATRLGEHLKVNRCAYAAVGADDVAIVLGNFTSGLPSVVGAYPLARLGDEHVRRLHAGQPYVVPDADAGGRPYPGSATDDPVPLQAFISVPVLKDGRLAATMSVSSKTRRQWTADEVELVERIAARCWESIERARVGQQLRESERQFRDLANSIANLAWMARADGWIYWYNDRWYEYTGTTAADMEGWGWRRAHDQKALPQVMDRWQRSIQTGEPFEMVFPLRGADGEFRRFLTRVNPVRDSQGQVVGWFGTNTDVENERRAAEVLDLLREREEQARRQAEAGSRAKDEFLAMLGHELRNPLSPILTALQLMKLRGEDRVERERTVIERQVRHLTRLVDDLLDVSRIARGKVELKEEVSEIAEVIAKAIEMASPLLEERAHALTVDVPPRAMAVNGDVARLAQVFANLLTNAAKYTSPGGHVSVTGVVEGADVVVRVRDNGIGIAPDILPTVFDLFVQEPQAIDRAQGGLGLGLTIVRSLVERHGGTVTATSAGRGAGSEFVVRLRRVEHAVGTRVATRAPAERDNSHVRVLVVDDNQDAAEMLVESLKAHRYSAQCVLDGPTALQAATDFQPHVAFVDIGLPVMDGYELANRLQSQMTNPPRLVAITGYGQDSDRARSLAAGFERHLVKPVDWQQVLEVLESVSATTDQ